MRLSTIVSSKTMFTQQQRSYLILHFVHDCIEIDCDCLWTMFRVGQGTFGQRVNVYVNQVSSIAFANEGCMAWALILHMNHAKVTSIHVKTIQWDANVIASEPYFLLVLFLLILIIQWLWCHIWIYRWDPMVHIWRFCRSLQRALFFAHSGIDSMVMFNKDPPDGKSIHNTVHELQP